MNIDWNQKKVAVLGLGVEGSASAEYLKRLGSQITILDPRPEDALKKETLHIAKELGVLIELEASFDDFSSYDAIIRSQWIKPSLPALVKAQAEGKIVTTQIDLFLQACKAKTIGVTGTKGKGTTSSLIYTMLKAQGYTVYLGGNIGVSPLPFLNSLNPNDWVVLELSSFQLEDITKSPHIAVMLMITSEHLQAFGPSYQNHHDTIEEYIDAKRTMLRFQTPTDFAILNRDYPASNESDIYTKGQVYHVTRERESVEQGCFVKKDAVWVKREGREYKVINTEEILLPGKHNLENVCAAVMAATLAGVPKDTIVKVLKTFKGLEHRLELVAEMNEVRYYDDSFSTTPETAIAAIQAFDAPEILILGGSHKGSDFSQLGAVIREAENIKAIIGIGVEWTRIKTQFKIQNSKFKIIEGLKDMHEIIQTASKIARPGDVVLLSPACASFDMFKNYKERGEQFKAEVNKLNSSFEK